MQERDKQWQHQQHSQQKEQSSISRGHVTHVGGSISRQIAERQSRGCTAEGADKGIRTNIFAIRCF